MSKTPYNSPNYNTNPGSNMPAWIVPAISGAVSLAQNIINNISKRKAAKRQRQQALDDWNMQNQYNSPASQMERFREAGLNPNEMYSQGQPGLADAPGQTEQYAPQYDLGNVAGNFMNDIYNFKTQKAGLDKIKEDTELTKEMRKAAELKNIMDLFKWNIEKANLPEVSQKKLEILRDQHITSAIQRQKLEDMDKAYKDMGMSWGKTIVENEYTKTADEKDLRDIEKLAKTRGIELTEKNMAMLDANITIIGEQVREIKDKNEHRKRVLQLANELKKRANESGYGGHTSDFLIDVAAQLLINL